MPQAASDPHQGESFRHLVIMTRLTAKKRNPVARYYTTSAVGKTEDVLNAPKRKFISVEPLYLENQVRLC